MLIEKYLKHLNNEDACGFTIDSFPTKANKRPLPVPYPNEVIEEAYDVNTKRIMIDLDGVIHDYSEGFKDGTIYGSVLNGAKEAIQELKNSGYEIIIFTSRLSNSINGEEEADKQKIRIKKWLSKNGIEVDGMTSEKLPAEVYVDDRAVHFNGNWSKALSEIKLRLDDDQNKL